MPSNSILIVDDTPNNIRVLFDVLDRAGFAISVVKSGEIALEKLDRIGPDLILLDVMMPGMDGFETCRRIKAQPENEDIPIIFMTALSETENKVSGLQIGAVDYITKPIQVAEVLARVNIHLRLRNTQRQLRQEIADRKQAEAALQKNLETLHQMQMQLVQTEKMSALGQMVAGVAHEINNPVNFIHGNLNHATEYAKALLHLIELYRQHFPDSPAAIKQAIEAIDLNFIEQDFTQVLSSMNMGTKRIREIVLSLRNFSRLDEAERKKVDIHEGLDSTLMLLQHRLKATNSRPEIQAIAEYAPLPKIDCYAGQLNQVFMNILSNAIDALEDSAVAPSPTITIRTTAIERAIRIAIADNGAGMSEAVRSQIFHPFFTTKAVGKGTGLGLFISYEIISKKHNGKLWCDSNPGQGTTFFIEIPQQQNELL
ncbi:MAG: response regulator [Oscillatoriaceae cyanobacterium Prado104]|jgi:signal transduction histidine kinase|nr:response regulator [Oscillatoriaceae cyanobacterium Prado104]